MGKVVEKKKKKGRPSLIDLQKRSLKLHQQKQQDLQHQRRPNPYIKRNSNPNQRADPITHNSALRSSRRESNSDLEDLQKAEEHLADEDDDDNSTRGRRREKKLNFFLRLPSQRDSSFLNSGSLASDSNPEEENGARNQNKRKINAVGGGSAGGISAMDEKLIICTSPQTDQQGGTQLDSGPSSKPLPDKKLLIFILDRLQKKDSYGVFSEPVDRDELPDYHDIIKHPMDFGTARDKLEGGAYSNLEQFEKDVFLICSNAMQYNSPDTVYFRQARSIQELAIKSFQNLRQDSDNSEQEQVIVRRGRPPTKNLKKPLGRPPLDRSRSDLSLDVTPVTSNYDLRKTDGSGPSYSSDLVFHGSRKSEPYTSLLAEQKLERNEEFTGSPLKGYSLKHGKKQSVAEENRRYTYKQFHGGEEPSSVLSTFHEERKQLMAVGLLAEFGYARSLSRFAATIGPIAWKIASSKIKSSLPMGVKFGPGWVGEPEPSPLPPMRTLPINPPFVSTSELPDTLDKSISSAESEELNNTEFQVQPSSGLNGTTCFGLPMEKLVTKDSSFSKVNYGDLRDGRAEKTMDYSVPPDLNVMFQTQQRSPTTGAAPSTKNHPDLALQL